jgi:hypothetical protein
MRQAIPSGWSSTEQRNADGTVCFEQRARPPAPAVDCSEDGARELATRYWCEVESCTRRLVQARAREEGIELRLLARWPLLSFGKPETRVERAQVLSRFPILGGSLARSPGRSITFAQTLAPALELRTSVEGFRPRLAGPNWIGAVAWESQRQLHLAVSRRYLARLVDRASR